MKNKTIEENPERVELATKVVTLSEMIGQMEGVISSAQQEMNRVINEVVDTGEANLKVFNKSDVTVRLYSRVMETLQSKLRDARKLVWSWDLLNAEEEVNEARRKSTEARQELISVQMNKAEYLKLEAGGRTIEDKRASYDILVIEATRLSVEAGKKMEQTRSRFETLKTEFNEVATELGEAVKELKFKEWVTHL